MSFLETRLGSKLKIETIASASGKEQKSDDAMDVGAVIFKGNGYSAGPVENDPSMSPMQCATRPTTEVAFRGSHAHFVSKNTTFRVCNLAATSPIIAPATKTECAT